jgi:hypothetical protein
LVQLGEKSSELIVPFIFVLNTQQQVLIGNFEHTFFTKTVNKQLHVGVLRQKLVESFVTDAQQAAIGSCNVRTVGIITVVPPFDVGEKATFKWKVEDTKARTIAWSTCIHNTRYKKAQPFYRLTLFDENLAPFDVFKLEFLVYLTYCSCR